MPVNTYPDGFPLTPIEAVNFSYFLSEEEKQDWREWLKTATPDQQKELVDTLHAMWEENQKEVVPSGFSANVNPPAAAPTDQNPTFSQPSPSSPVQSSPAGTSPEPNANSYAQPSQVEKKPEDTFNFMFDSDDEAEQLQPQAVTNSEPSLPEPQAIPQPTPEPEIEPAAQELPVSDTPRNESLMNFANPKYKPNPILEDNTPTPTEFSYSNEERAQEVSERKPNNPNNSQNGQNKGGDKPRQQNNPTNQGANSNQNSGPKPFFNVAKVREAATRTALEDLYQQYLTSREKSFSSEREYYENHGMFLDKVMQVVVNFEQVADYFEAMTQKLLEMNDRLVKQAKDFQDLKNSLTSKQTDQQDLIDELRRDVDRLFRETKDIRGDYRRRYDEMSEQMAAYGADAYRQDGILQRLDLLMAKVHKLEQVGKETGKVESISIAERLRNNATNSKPQNNEDSKTGNGGTPKPGRQSIDLRSVI